MNKGINDEDGDRTASADANLESAIGNAPLGSDEVPTFVAPVRVTFHHTRKRLADIDGLSGKAVLDGIVALGILADDKAEQVTEVTHRQEKGRMEKTVVVIETERHTEKITDC